MYDLRFQGIENCQDLILLSFADPAFVQRIENVVTDRLPGVRSAFRRIAFLCFC